MRDVRLVATSSDEIAARVRDFLSDTARGGPEIRDLVDLLGSLGDVGLFGGMPRDLARAGAAAFRSDVDLVVDTSPEKLADFMRDRQAKKNRFGGYRLGGERHVFDVWALSSTWAVKSGKVEATSLPDLVRTTFFDCDAIVYLCATDRVHHARNYVENIRSGVVDLVLEANPNLAGMVGRALRLLVDWKYTAGPGLAAFLSRALVAPELVLDDRSVEFLARFAHTSSPTRCGIGATEKTCVPARARHR